MSKRLKSIAVAVALSLVCMPLSACNSVFTAEPDLNIVGGSSSAIDTESTVTPRDNDVVQQDEQTDPEPVEPNEPGTTDPTDPTDPEPTEPNEPEEEPDPELIEYVPTTDVWSVDYSDAYLWDGDLVKAGWADSATFKALRPDSYSIDRKEKKIIIGSASALAYFAHQCTLANNEGFEGFTVTLDCNIDLGGDDNVWIPVPFSSHSDTEKGEVTDIFKGTFDGQGHTIYNLSAKKFYESVKYRNNGFVVSVQGVQQIRTVVEETGEVKITGTKVDADIPLQVDDGGFIYGLFGTVGNATFKNLNVAYVHIDATDVTIGDNTLVTVAAGALVGFPFGDLTVEGCVAGSEDVSINPDAQAKNYIKNVMFGGGLVGYVGEASKAVTIKNSANYLNINYTATALVDDEDDEEDEEPEIPASDIMSGGIIGAVNNVAALTIEDCENYGSLAGSYVGGAVSAIVVDTDGDHSVSIIGFKNYGVVIGDSGNSVYAAGVVGQVVDHTSEEEENGEGEVQFVFTDCFNYANITVDQTAKGGMTVGGIIAEISLTAQSGKLSFEHNFNYGDIAGQVAETGKTGGLIGSISVGYEKEDVIISGGNCGRITGGGEIAGCIVGSTDAYTVKYLINANKVGTNG